MGATLRELAAKRGLQIGAAVSAGPLREDPVYREIIAREFNVITCENEMKWRCLRPAREKYAFEEADEIVAFAKANGIAVRGHTLIWHNVLPDWFGSKTWGYDDAVDVVRSHIQTVTRYYRGSVAAWDVVNEGIDDQARYRDTPFLRIFGQDYIDMAFHWAHEGDPDAKLFYNDYSADSLNRKSAAIYRLVRDMLRRGVPIHGVGLQMHVELSNPPKPCSVAANIRRFRKLGLDVHVTEMDVRIKEPVSSEDLKKQAQFYRDIMKACLATKCGAFIVWGVTDRYSWVPEFFKGQTAALLFDNEANPKPAYWALCEALDA